MDQEVELVPELVEAVARKWCEVVSEGDAAAMWFLTDANLRLCLAQRWVHECQNNPLVAGLGDPQALAELLSSSGPPDGAAAEMWPPLLVETCRYVSSQVPPFPVERWGVPRHRRVAGPDLEVVLLLDTSEIAEIPAGEALLVSPELGRTFLLRNDGLSQPEVAGFSHSAPRPGWPPTIPTDL